MFVEKRGHFLLPLALQRKLCHAADARGRRRRHPEGTCINSKPGRRVKRSRRTSSAAGQSSIRFEGAGNPGRTLWRFRRCLECDQLQTAPHRRHPLSALEHAAPDRTAAKKSYVQELLSKEQGAFVAVSDNIRTVPDQIAPWVPGGLFTLGNGRLWPQRHPRTAPALL